ATEVKLLLSDRVFESDTTRFAVAHVDSMRAFHFPNGDDRIIIYDHAPGFPTQIVSSGLLPVRDALQALTDSARSDIVWSPARFDLQVAGLDDTTFVARSGDRQRILFGEGATGNGRVIMWNSPTSTISNELTIADLVGNSAAHVVSLDLNQDG